MSQLSVFYSANDQVFGLFELSSLTQRSLGTSWYSINEEQDSQDFYVDNTQKRWHTSVPGAGLKQAEWDNKFHNHDKKVKITKFTCGIRIVRFYVHRKTNRNLQNTWCL